MPQAPPRQKITIFLREMCANFWNRKKVEYDNETRERETGWTRSVLACGRA